VAVLIPCFNAGDLLAEAVSSIREEEPVELVVIDDASDDPTTRRVLAALEAGGTRILRQPTNRGAAAARTAGLALTSAPYVFPLDADDLAVPGAIVEAADRLDAAPDAVACVGHYQEFGSSRFVRQVPDVLDPYRLAYNNDYPVTSLFRRTALERAGGWRDPVPARPGYEDWNLWMTLAESGGRIVHLGPAGVLYRRRVHSPAAVASVVRPHADLYRALRAGHPELFGRLAEHRRRSHLGRIWKLAYPLLFGERRRVRGQRALKPWMDRAGLWTGRR
jgi:glycosyltransferase involved in cell wall biosynthesis